MVLRACVTGTYTDSAQGLGERDCMYTVHKGLFDRDNTWHRARVTHSAEVKGRTVSSRSCYRELRISCCSCTTCWMFWRSKKWKSSNVRPNPVHKLHVLTFKNGKLPSNMEIGMNPCSIEGVI